MSITNGATKSIVRVSREHPAWSKEVFKEKWVRPRFTSLSYREMLQIYPDAPHAKLTPATGVGSVVFSGDEYTIILTAAHVVLPVRFRDEWDLMDGASFLNILNQEWQFSITSLTAGQKTVPAQLLASTLFLKGEPDLALLIAETKEIGDLFPAISISQAGASEGSHVRFFRYEDEAIEERRDIVSRVQLREEVETVCLSEGAPKGFSGSPIISRNDGLVGVIFGYEHMEVLGQSINIGLGTGSLTIRKMLARWAEGEAIVSTTGCVPKDLYTRNLPEKIQDVLRGIAS